VVVLFAISSLAVEEPVTFRVGWEAEIPSLNPATNWAEEGGHVINTMFDNLYVLDENMEPVPLLVVDERISGDLLTWDLTITDKASWHDGTPLTADDIVYNFRVLLKTMPPLLTPNIEFIESVEKTGSYSIRFKMKYAQPLRLTKVFLAEVRLIFLPPHLLPSVEDITLQDVLDYKPRLGNGPFKFVEWKKDQYVILEANKGYWRGAPKVDRLIFKRYDSETATVEALLAGEVDLAFEITAVTLVPRVKAAPGFDVMATESQWLHDVIFNMANWNENIRPAILQPEVRRAIAHLIDVHKIIEIVWLGYAKPYPWLFPDAGPYPLFINRDIKYYEFDIALAKNILEGNGWVDKDGDGIREKTLTYTIKPMALKDGKHQVDAQGNLLRVPQEEWTTKTENFELDFEVWIETSYAVLLRVFEIIKEAAAEAGINLRPTIMEGAKMYDQIWGEDGYRADFDILGWGWNIGADPTFILDWLSAYQIGGWSDSNYHNPEFNRLYVAQKKELDPQKRIQMIKRMQELVHQDLPYIIMYWPDKIDGYSEKWEGHVKQDLVGITNYHTFLNVRPKE
jgi:peptide/nickel transport system substrate-binding protein